MKIQGILTDTGSPIYRTFADGRYAIVEGGIGHGFRATGDEAPAGKLLEPVKLKVIFASAWITASTPLRPANPCPSAQSS